MTNEVLEKELLGNKIRPTAVRIRVLEFFKDYPFAVSLNDLEQVLQPVDRTTLFRTIKTFEEGGILHSINEENGLVKFALCSDDCSCSYTDHSHVHFSCKTCLKTYCLFDVRIEDINLPEEFIPLDASVVIKGICNHCSN